MLPRSPAIASSHLRLKSNSNASVPNLKTKRSAARLCARWIWPFSLAEYSEPEHLGIKIGFRSNECSSDGHVNAPMVEVAVLGITVVIGKPPFLTFTSVSCSRTFTKTETGVVLIGRTLIHLNRSLHGSKGR